MVILYTTYCIEYNCQVMYRAAMWIGYYWLLPDIIFPIYFQNSLTCKWQKCMETMAHSVEVQKYRSSSHKTLLQHLLVINIVKPQ